MLLPQPLSPTSPSVSPRRRTKSTPSTAFTVPTVWLRIAPRVTGKCLVSARASSTTASSPSSGWDADAGIAPRAATSAPEEATAAARAPRRPVTAVTAVRKHATS